MFKTYTTAEIYTTLGICFKRGKKQVLIRLDRVTPSTARRAQFLLSMMNIRVGGTQTLNGGRQVPGIVFEGSKLEIPQYTDDQAFLINHREMWRDSAWF